MFRTLYVWEPFELEIYIWPLRGGADPTEYSPNLLLSYDKDTLEFIEMNPYLPYRWRDEYLCVNAQVMVKKINHLLFPELNKKNLRK